MKAKKLPHLKHIVRLGAEKTPGMLNFDDVAGAGGNAERMKLAELGPKLQFDDAINIQFTSGTTGHPEGRDAQPPQHPEQRLLRRPRG